MAHNYVELLKDKSNWNQLENHGIVLGTRWKVAPGARRTSRIIIVETLDSAGIIEGSKIQTSQYVWRHFIVFVSLAR